MSTQENIKMIDIREATEGEAQKIEHHFTNYDSFKQELKIINQVNNIFDDPRVKIKKDGNRYIFNIDGKNKFTIPEGKMESRVWKYCKEMETREAEEDLLIRITGFKLEYIKVTTKEDLAMLKDDITRLKNQEAKETDMESTKKVLARNIKFLEGEKEYSKDVDKDDKIDRNLRKAYRSQVQDRLDRLYRMKETMERLEKNDAKNYTIKRENVNGKNEIQEVKMDDINAYNKQETLMQINQRLEEIAREEDDFRATRDMIINRETSTIPYYEIIINDKSDARKLRNSLKKVNKQYVILDKLSLDAAKKQELAQDLQDLEEYLNNVITQPDAFKPSERPFIPKHTKEFYELVKIDPTLSEFFSLNKTKTKVNNRTENADEAGGAGTGTTNTETGTTTTETGTTTTETGTGKTTEDTRNFTDKNYIETFKEGGIRGIIRKTLNMFPNMKDSSKNTRTNLLVVGGVGFGLFKLGRRLFSGKRSKNQKEKTPFRQRILIAGGITLGFNAFGTNPIKFAEQFVGGGLDPKTLKLQRPRAKNETVDDPSKELTMLELNQIFGNATITQLKNSIDPKTFKLTDDGYQKLLLSFQGTDDESKTKREIIQKMRDNKDKDILKTSFAKIGITPENIDNLNQNKTVQAYTGETYNTNNEGTDTWDGVDDPKINITDQVKNFNLTQDQKNKLIKYGNILYDERPTSTSQKVEFKEDNSNIYLKTYKERTRIDIEKLTIPGYVKANGDPIVFSGMKELMKAANLTNYLKYIFRGKAKGNKYDPFESSGAVGVLTRDRNDIMFNDNDNSRYNPTHTEAIDAGRFGTLSTVSPKIAEFKSEYITYLNTLQIRNESQATKDLAK